MREMAERITGQPTVIERGVEPLGFLLSWLEMIPVSTYILGMFGSVIASMALFLGGRRWEALFVGLWPSTVLSLGLFLKLTRPSREIR